MFTRTQQLKNNQAVVVSLPNLLYFVLLSKNYISSTVCSLLQGPYSLREERINFHVFFTRVYYIFQNLQGNSSKLTRVGLERVLSEPNAAQKIYAISCVDII